MDVIKEKFEMACYSAAEKSKIEDCTIHVNAVVHVVYGTPTIVGFRVSDWYCDGSTVKSYSFGREH